MSFLLNTGVFKRGKRIDPSARSKGKESPHYPREMIQSLQGRRSLCFKGDDPSTSREAIPALPGR
jgi:hypothetical protein